MSNLLSIKGRTAFVTGLTDIALRRCLAEMGMFGDGDHIFQIPDIHRSYLSI